MKFSFLFIPLVTSSRLQSAPGVLDTSFGSGTGFVRTGISPGSFDSTYASAIQADGKLVLSGYTFQQPPFGPRQLVVVRYNTDGSLDTTFATGGKFVLTVPGWPQTSWDGSGLSILPDGKILAAGSAGTEGTIRVLVRLTSSGQLDLSFGASQGVPGTGIIYSTLPAEAYAFRGFSVSNQGKIAVAGDEITPGAPFIHLFTPNGSTLRFRTLPQSSVDKVSSMIFEGEKIVLLGDFYSSNGGGLAIERYLESGSLDTTFNGTGGVVIDSSHGDTLALQSDGKIIVAGHVRVGGLDKPSVFRFNQNGTADHSFGNNGVALLDITGFGTRFTFGLAVQTNGKLLLASTAAVTGTGFALLRLNANGSLDSSFGQGGIANDVTLPGDRIDGGFYAPRSIEISNDGSIYVSGLSNASFRGDHACDFAVAKFRGDPSLSDLETWRLTNFGSSADAGSGADGFDYDKDGLVNLVEYAFGLDPKSGQSLRIPSWNLDGNSISVNFDTPSGVNGIVYGAEWSNSLSGTWNSITDTGMPPQHVFAIPRNTSNPLFVRLRVMR